jgi:hypothetical protein
MGICWCRHGDRDLGGNWARLSLFRHLAAGDQYRYNDRHVSDGLPDSEHAKPGRTGDQPQTQ